MELRGKVPNSKSIFNRCKLTRLVLETVPEREDHLSDTEGGDMADRLGLEGVESLVDQSRFRKGKVDPPPKPRRTAKRKYRVEEKDWGTGDCSVGGGEVQVPTEQAEDQPKSQTGPGLGKKMVQLTIRTLNQTEEWMAWLVKEMVWEAQETAVRQEQERKDALEAERKLRLGRAAAKKDDWLMKRLQLKLSREDRRRRALER